MMARFCHYCKLEIPANEKAVEATTKNAWAHFTYWYDSGPFEAESHARWVAEQDT